MLYYIIIILHVYIVVLGRTQSQYRQNQYSTVYTTYVLYKHEPIKIHILQIEYK